MISDTGRYITRFSGLDLKMTSNQKQGVEIGRRNLDFPSLGPVCYGRDEAKFQLPDHGWPHARHAK